MRRVLLVGATGAFAVAVAPPWVGLLFVYRGRPALAGG